MSDDDRQNWPDLDPAQRDAYRFVVALVVAVIGAAGLVWWTFT